jgi:hypothetical protein
MQEQKTALQVVYSPANIQTPLPALKVYFFPKLLSFPVFFFLLTIGFFMETSSEMNCA